MPTNATGGESTVAEKVDLPEKELLLAVFPGELSEKCLAILFAPNAQAILRRLRRQIHAALNMISYRERAILEMRFGLGDGYRYSLAEGGYVFQLTRERIRQIQNKAIAKLRDRAKKLHEFVREFNS